MPGQINPHHAIVTFRGQTQSQDPTPPIPRSESCRPVDYLTSSTVRFFIMNLQSERWNLLVNCVKKHAAMHMLQYLMRHGCHSVRLIGMVMLHQLPTSWDKPTTLLQHTLFASNNAVHPRKDGGPCSQHSDASLGERGLSSSSGQV